MSAIGIGIVVILGVLVGWALCWRACHPPKPPEDCNCKPYFVIKLGPVREQ